MMESKRKFVYRAGTEHGPVFDVEHYNDKFEDWLVTDPQLYDSIDQRFKGSSKVWFWKAAISQQPGILVTEARNPNNPESIFNGVCLVKSKDSEKSLEELLRSLEWEKTSVETDSEGFSLMDFSTLVQAVVQYMKDNNPTSPQESNFQAELKAACHWHWSEKDVQCLERGPHYNWRVKIAARSIYQKWLNDYKKAETQKSDLESRIFDLVMYYDDLREPECKRSRGTSQSPSTSYPGKSPKKRPRNEVEIPSVTGENKEYKAGSKKKVTPPNGIYSPLISFQRPFPSPHP